MVQAGRSTYIAPKNIVVDDDVLFEIKAYIDNLNLGFTNRNSSVYRRKTDLLVGGDVCIGITLTNTIEGLVFKMAQSPFSTYTKSQ